MRYALMLCAASVVLTGCLENTMPRARPNIPVSPMSSAPPVPPSSPAATRPVPPLPTPPVTRPPVVASTPAVPPSQGYPSVAGPAPRPEGRQDSVQSLLDRALLCEARPDGPQVTTALRNNRMITGKGKEADIGLVSFQPATKALALGFPVRQYFLGERLAPGDESYGDNVGVVVDAPIEKVSAALSQRGHSFRKNRDNPVLMSKGRNGILHLSPSGGSPSRGPHTYVYCSQ